MKGIQAWLTDDGQVFLDKTEAREHEKSVKRQEIIEAVSARLRTVLSNEAAQAAARTIAENFDVRR